MIGVVREGLVLEADDVMPIRPLPSTLSDNFGNGKGKYAGKFGGIWNTLSDNRDR